MTKNSIVMVRCTELMPADYNPRAIVSLNLDALKKSLEKFGMPQPIIVNKKTGFIVGGHQRLRAAIELGWDQVPVTYVDLAEAKEKALNVALNSNKLEGFFTDDLHAFLTDLKEDISDNDFKDLRLDELMEGDWDSDIGSLDKIEENLDGIQTKITVRCPQDLKDEVLIFLKAKFLETSFEGIHVE